MGKWSITVVLGLLAWATGAAWAQGSGVSRIDRLQHPLAMASITDLSAAPSTPSARQDRLESAAGGGRGWWRLHPSTSLEERLLLVFHPYSAQLTVLLPPHYRPQRQTIFDHGLDPRYSRRALVFPIEADGPIYVGVEHGRYPLQVRIQGVASHAVSDRSHLQVLYTATGVLVGVCLVTLVFWLVLRDRVCILYAGCMALQLLYVLCAYGEAYALPGLRLLGSYGAQAIWVVATLTTVVSVAFLLDFGELRTRTPKLGRWLTWLGAYLPLLTLIPLLSPWPADKSWFPNLGNLLLLLANVLAIACLGLAWRRGGRHAGMMLLAWVPLVVVSTARALQLSSGAPLAPWLEYGLPLVLAYTAVVLMLGMADRMRAFRHERDRAQTEAERDALTGALNRTGIQRRLGLALEACVAGGQPLAVLFLDIDHFKQINDNQGHDIGDACLRMLVQILSEHLSYEHHVGRLGGEEFLLVLPATDRRRARDLAELIRRTVETRCRQIAGVPIGMTVSIGVAERRAGDVPPDLIARADAAMYAAKRAGRNRVVSAEAALTN